MNFNNDFPDFTRSSGHSGHVDHSNTQSMANLRAVATTDNTHWGGFGEQGHAAAGNSMAYAMNGMPPRPDNQAFLAMVTKEDLMRANNYAYISLHNEKMILLARLEAQSLLVSDLRGIIATSRPAHPPEPRPPVDRIGPAPSTMALLSAQPTHVDSDRMLPSTVPPPQCDRVDFPDVAFWTKAAWSKYVYDEGKRNRKPQRTGFITDEAGVPVDDDRLADMTAMARSLFVEIYRSRCDPESWGAVGRSAAEYFNNSLATNYPEFQWAEGQWKCTSFATLQYPIWKRDHREKGKITRNRPSIQPQKRKLDSNNKVKSSVKDKGRKRQKPSAPSSSDVPSELDVDAASTIRNVVAKPTGLHQTPTTSPARISSPELEYVDSDHNLAASAPASAHSDTPHVARQPSPPAVHQPSRAADTPPIPSHPPPEPLVAAVGSLEVTQPPPSLATTQTDTRDASAPSENTPPIAVNHLDSGTSVPAAPPAPTHVLRRRNILNDLPIPRPNIEVPYQPPSAAAVANSKKKPVAKGIQPSKALTARNLFMIDYLKDKESVTAAAFKTAYDSLDEVSRKKYDDLSKQLKSNKRTAPAPPTSAGQEIEVDMPAL